MRRRLLGVGSLLLSLLLSRTSWADGVMLNGVSAQTIGRGGANIAHFDNGAVLHDNPAAMTMIDSHSMLELGGTLLLTNFQYGDAENSRQTQNRAYGLAEFAMIRRSCDERWAAGFGVFSPCGFGSIYDLESSPPFAGVQRYKSFGTLVKLLPGVAFRPTERLSLGATLGAGITIADLEGPYVLQGPSFLRGTPTLLDLDADGAALIWSLGLMYKFSDCTSVGVSYLSESRFEAGGTTLATVPGLGQSFYETQLDITWPRSLGLGVRHELCSHRILSTDVIWYDWSGAFDSFGIHLSRPTNGFFPSFTEQFPLDWRDTVSVRVGLEQRIGCDQMLRLGYVYHRVPIPTSTVTPFIPASLEHAFSAGYGITLCGWDVNVAYMYTFGPEVTVETSGFVGGDFDQSQHRSQTHAISVGLLRRF
jgi:long-subunit fatty acid transport protein